MEDSGGYPLVNQDSNEKSTGSFGTYIDFSKGPKSPFQRVHFFVGPFVLKLNWVSDFVLKNGAILNTKFQVNSVKIGNNIRIF